MIFSNETVIKYQIADAIENCRAPKSSCIEDDKVSAGIVTSLPKKFPLETGGSIEILEDEILYKAGQFTVH